MITFSCQQASLQRSIASNRNSERSSTLGFAGAVASAPSDKISYSCSTGVSAELSQSSRPALSQLVRSSPGGDKDRGPHHNVLGPTFTELQANPAIVTEENAVLKRRNEVFLNQPLQVQKENERLKEQELMLLNEIAELKARLKDPSAQKILEKNPKIITSRETASCWRRGPRRCHTASWSWRELRRSSSFRIRRKRCWNGRRVEKYFWEWSCNSGDPRDAEQRDCLVKIDAVDRTLSELRLPP
jgi:hypothetical protein